LEKIEFSNIISSGHRRSDEIDNDCSGNCGFLFR